MSTATPPAWPPWKTCWKSSSAKSATSTSPKAMSPRTAMAGLSSPEASIWTASPTWWRASTARKRSNPPRWAGWSANGWGACPSRARASTATAYVWKYWSPTGCASARSESASPKQLPNEQSPNEYRIESRVQAGIQIGVCLHHRPAECRKVHVAERPGRPEGGHRRRQAADHADVDTGRGDSARGADRFHRYTRHPSRQLAAQQAPDGYRAEFAGGTRPAGVCGRRRAPLQRTGPPRNRRGAPRRYAVCAGAQQGGSAQGQVAAAAAD